MKALIALIAGLVLALPATAQSEGEAPVIGAAQPTISGTGSGGGELPASSGDSDDTANLPVAARFIEEITFVPLPAPNGKAFVTVGGSTLAVPTAIGHVLEATAPPPDVVISWTSGGATVVMNFWQKPNETDVKFNARVAGKVNAMQATFPKDPA